MEAHYQYSDTDFEKKFRDGSFPPHEFTHEAHLRLAWISILKYGEAEACTRICEQIRDFDQLHGKGDKFHRTITMAAVKAVNHFINRSDASSFAELIKEHPRLKYNFKDLIDHHYSYNIFSSKEARTEYVAPDLLPFD